METKTNDELRIAWDFVEHTGRSIFLTGKAGTGKTTFLKTVVEQSKKRTIVVAPTGVAAINAGRFDTACDIREKSFTFSP